MPSRTITQTERLLIREFCEDDLDAYHALGAHPEVTRYTGTGQFADRDHALRIMRAHPLTDYRERGYGRWACVWKQTGEVIGFAGLKWLDDLQDVDIGIWLFPAFWRMGIGTEAGRAVLAHGFGPLGLKRIIGLADVGNEGSIRLQEKLGMRRTEEKPFDGQMAVWFEVESSDV